LVEERGRYSNLPMGRFLPENPYWKTTEDSVTVEDADGWRVALVKPRG